MRRKAFISSIITGILMIGCISSVQAEIIPSKEESWQIGPPAVVICDSLTMRQEGNDGAATVESLPYGSHILVVDQSDGWTKCVLGDSEDALSGWVKTDFIVVNPAKYRTDEPTPVYAWNDMAAPKVAVLDSNTTLPILKDEGDWLIVSLRGATGWIHNPE